MFLFSKKLVFLVVLVSLLFGGGRNSVEGEFNKCHECKGDGVDHEFPYCDADHSGEDLGTNCFPPKGACYMRKDANGISKSCERDSTKWQDANGNPKCIPNQECYCNDNNFCNKDKNFGVKGGAGTPGGGGAGTPGAGGNSGSMGTKDMFRGISILFGMMAAVAATSVSSVFISS